MTITSDHLQGRVISGLALIGSAVTPVGPLASGLILDRWGVRAALLSIASVMAVVALGATLSDALRPTLDHGAVLDGEAASAAGPFGRRSVAVVVSRWPYTVDLGTPNGAAIC
ncbi:hypothetical protein [Nonomuraea sp. NPDC049400]|uniref:hypothetical protein n=1 Tax=Nonomuraea sp. NPDC049400 TaxID=3364352 RepID=UPI0037B129F7